MHCVQLRHDEDTSYSDCSLFTFLTSMAYPESSLKVEKSSKTTDTMNRTILADATNHNAASICTLERYYVTVDQSTSRPVDQSTSRPVDQSTSRPVDQSTSRPVDQPTSRPVDQPTSRPADQSTSRPVDQSTNRSIDQSLFGIV